MNSEHTGCNCDLYFCIIITATNVIQLHRNPVLMGHDIINWYDCSLTATVTIITVRFQQAVLRWIWQISC